MYGNFLVNLMVEINQKLIFYSIICSFNMSMPVLPKKLKIQCCTNIFKPWQKFNLSRHTVHPIDQNKQEYALIFQLI